jgi:putative flippase GtrA
VAFRVRRKLTPQALEFQGVTLSNVMLVQPIVVLLVPGLLTAKLAAIFVGVTWNFCWFNRRVFAR